MEMVFRRGTKFVRQRRQSGAKERAGGESNAAGKRIEGGSKVFRKAINVIDESLEFQFGANRIGLQSGIGRSRKQRVARPGRKRNESELVGKLVVEHLTRPQSATSIEDSVRRSETSRTVCSQERWFSGRRWHMLEFLRQLPAGY